jgi:chloramphenicol 3-O-phosphotransferase
VASPSSEPFVLLVTGVSASGKSTVADALARRFERGVHVRGDVFRKMVVTGRVEMSATPSPEAWAQLRLRYRLAASTADAYFDDGFSVVVQDVVIGSVLTEVVSMIQATPLHVVVLTPSPEAVQAREAARSKEAYRPGSITVDELDRALRHETPHSGLWLDSSDQTVDRTVQQILDRWDESRVR